MCQSQAKRIEDFLIQERIPLPSLSESRPKSEPEAVPMGVKLTDKELANGVSLKIAGAIVQCATGMAQSIRTDVGMMWGEFLQEETTFSISLKNIMRKRGWLMIPPYYFPPGLPK